MGAPVTSSTRPRPVRATSPEATSPRRVVRALRSLGAPSTTTVTMWTSDHLPLHLFLVAAVLASRRVGGSDWLITGDVVAALAIATSMLRVRDLGSLRPPRWLQDGGALLVAIALSVFLAGPQLDVVESWRSFAKLALYGVAVVFFAHTWRSLTDEQVGATVRLHLRVAALVVVAQQVAHAVGVALPLLPRIGTVEFDYVGTLPRSYGFFSEPSTMALFFVVLCFAALSVGKLTTADLSIVVFAVLLTGSLSGVFLLGAMVVLGTARGRASLRRLRRPFVVLGVLILLVALVVPSARRTVTTRIVDRVPATLSGDDASGSGRLFDSWEAAVAVAGGHVVTGAGFGQQSLRLRELSSAGTLDVDPRLVTAGGGWNVFANVYADLGVVGLGAVGLLIWSALRPSRAALLLGVGVCFATGTMLGWAWWCFLAVLADTARRRAAFARGDSAVTARRSRADASPEAVRPA